MFMLSFFEQSEISNINRDNNHRTKHH